ncbi:hypothetical protein Nepgr_013683 [Nepenthes gracilis]|uniref:Uncharacterized protein n=1 Tax=Nepenthes gracilis TaxID=150966 RepID=A0AAD3SIT5_NEPGR|nr:hypothetical protein Nepgr_013683 [Nepenthes gracilis]
MGRAPCCDKSKVKRGPWSPEEDETLKNYVNKYGTGGNWIAFPHKAGLRRCGKSCRLRWLNYLRPNIKRGGFTEEEDNIIISLYAKIGSRWSVIASNLPGRTDNDVKNYWNTKLKKKLFGRNRSNSHLSTKATTTTIDDPIPNLNNINLHGSSSSLTAANDFFIDDQLYIPSFSTPLTQSKLTAFTYDSYNLITDELHTRSLVPGLIQYPTPQGHQATNSSSQEASRTISGSPSSSSLTLDQKSRLFFPFANMGDDILLGDFGLGFADDRGGVGYCGQDDDEQYEIKHQVHSFSRCY